MAINTKYTFDELYRAYREQYERSESQLGQDVLPKREMYSKREFIQDWSANKASNKGMSGVRVAEKLARNDVYLHSKKQAEAVYKSVFEEDINEREDLQERISNLREELNRAKSKKDKEFIENDIKPLEKEERALKKKQTQFSQKFRTGRLDEEMKEKIEDLYTDISSYYYDLKNKGYSGKEAKAKVAKKFFSWKYLD